MTMMMMMITFQRTVVLTCTTVQAQGVTSIAPGTSTCTYITILVDDDDCIPMCARTLVFFNAPSSGTLGRARPCSSVE